ncbi:MAG: O-antigen ligase family protein [Holophagales bacterium]|nr:O-antigen ligase family protein [Holophagales bacterium]
MALSHVMAAANVAFALALLASLVWRVRARKAGGDALGPFRRPSPLHGPVALFVLLSILSIFFSTDVVRSAGEVKGFVTFLLVVLVSGLVDGVEDAHLVVDALRLTTLYLVLRGLVDYFVRGYDNVWERLSGGLSVYMTYAGLLMVLSLVLAARALTAGRRRRERLVDGVLAAAAVLLVGLSFTRNAYLGLAAGAVVLVLTARPRFSLALLPLAVLLFAVLPAGVRERAATTFDRTDSAARDRLSMWSAGAVMISERPFFGVGPGRVKELYPVYRQPGFVEARVGHLHNNLVNLAAETGIPSALAYLAIVGAAFVAAWPLSRDRTRPDVRALARGALAANAALFVAGMFEYSFGDVEILRVMLVVLALPFAAAGAAPAPAPPVS